MLNTQRTHLLYIIHITIGIPIITLIITGPTLNTEAVLDTARDILKNIVTALKDGSPDHHHENAVHGLICQKNILIKKAKRKVRKNGEKNNCFFSFLACSL